MKSSFCLCAALALSMLGAGRPSLVGAQDPLPSWNETQPKQAIIDFVRSVSTDGSPEFVPPSERIAVFDNDGTLWPEVPLPFQVVFAFDELKRRVPQEPQLAQNEMVQAALQGDFRKLLAGKHYDGLLQVLALTHAGMTTDEFDARVLNWMATARHPDYGRHYSQLTYQPMQELLSYLRDHGFKTFIVSGGGADFMRVWSEKIYGIPPENVVGSTGQVKFEMRDGQPVLIKTLDQIFVDDKEGKPAGIHQFIGRRPIACFGNSDGDQAMLEYTTIGNPLPSLGLLVHHTDGEREVAYDANPPSSGKLTTALTEAAQRGWTVVSMKDDWNKLWSESEQTADGNAAKLIGSWLVEDIRQAGVVDDAQSTLEFVEGGMVSGSTAVNRFSGKADIDGQQLKFGPLAVTRRAGPPALMDQESKFLAAMNLVTSFRFKENGLLSLTDAQGGELMRLSRMAIKPAD